MAAIAILPSKERRAVIWRADTGEQVRNLAAPGSDARIGFAGGRLTLLGEGRLQLLDVQTGAMETEVDGVLTFAASPDGATLVAVERGKGNDDTRRLVLRDIASGAETAHFEVETVQEAVPAFTPDGATLLVGTFRRGDTGYGRVYVWDVAAGSLVEPMEGHQRQVSCFAFSEDGARWATGSTDSTVILWDGATRAKRLELAGHASNINALAFSPDGTRLVTASLDGTFKLWDTENGREILTVQNAAYGAEGQVVTPDFAAFSPDGAELITLTAPEPLAPRILRALPSEEAAYGLEDEKALGEALEAWKRTAG